MENRFLLIWSAPIALGFVALGCLDLTGPENEAISVEVHAGSRFSCGIWQDAEVHCWGVNNVGQLGDGTTDNRGVPRLLAGGLSFRSIGIDGLGAHACGVTTSGDVYCWGQNRYGQLGDGTADNSSSPVLVAGGLSFSSVSAGWRFTCGVTRAGEGYCWGRGTWGQLGNGQTNNSRVPVRVTGNHIFESIKVGSSSLACGLTSSQRALCWGLNWRGEVGAATTEMCESGPYNLACSSVPVRVSTPAGAEFRAVSPGSSYACGVLTNGEAFCWGRNSQRQLGSATDEICLGGPSLPDALCSQIPVAVGGGHRFKMVVASSSHTCGVTEDDAAYCWGRNNYGQLGNGAFRTEDNPPVRVRGGYQFDMLSTGGDHTCGATTDGKLYCWGINDVGQLGNPAALIQEIPILVARGTG